MKITLQEQECQGNSKFSGPIVYTKSFGEVFKDRTTEIIIASMSLIFDLVNQNVADYLQVLTVETNTGKVRLCVIDDGACVIFLLPEDY